MICCFNFDIFVVIFFQVFEINGFFIVGWKKNGEVEDELDWLLEGMEYSDDYFDKGEEIQICKVKLVYEFRDLFIWKKILGFGV